MSPARITVWMKNKAAWRWATWFGCGYSPKAPGTVGSLGAFVIAAPLLALGMPWWGWIVLAVAALYPSIRVSSIVAAESGRKDPQFVVIDEVVGQWITLAGISKVTWWNALLAFGLFRLFDIWKPWPVRNFERLPRGAGIVMDDIMAGIYAALVLFAVGWFNR